MSSKSITLAVGESVRLQFNFTRALETLWRPGYEYGLGEYVRPLTPNGFEYTVSNAGQSDNIEPKWPIVIDDSVVDGSVVWDAKDFGTSATDTLSTGPVTTDGTGTVGTPTVEDTDVFCLFTATAKGTEIVSCNATTAAGEAITARFRVVIQA